MSEESTKNRLERIEKYIKNAAPAEDWKGTGNIPFYVDLKKPRPSLSKHDNEESSYWHYDDGVFVLSARRDLPWLVEEYKKLQKENQKMALELLAQENEKLEVK